MDKALTAFPVVMFLLVTGIKVTRWATGLLNLKMGHSSTANENQSNLTFNNFILLVL